MSNAGYGNHDEPPPATEAANTAPRAESRPGSAEPVPPSAAAEPKQGAGSDGPQGDEVDPGVG